jgi:hypothetical protein
MVELEAAVVLAAPVAVAIPAELPTLVPFTAIKVVLPEMIAVEVAYSNPT